MTTIVLVPGWGFDRSFWRPVADALHGFAVESWDLGFRGTEKSATLNDPDRPLIAVGHSLGFAWLLELRPFAWDAWVAVNGFTRFSRAPDFDHGIAGRVLDRMIAKFAHDPYEVAADFLARCGSDDRPEKLDEARMATGLGWLRDWDLRARFEDETAPGLVLAGRQDPIVTPGMTNDCFGAKTVWLETGGHLLPQTDPAWTAGRIARFAEITPRSRGKSS